MLFFSPSGTVLGEAQRWKNSILSFHSILYRVFVLAKYTQLVGGDRTWREEQNTLGTSMIFPQDGKGYKFSKLEKEETFITSLMTDLNSKSFSKIINGQNTEMLTNVHQTELLAFAIERATPVSEF